MSLTIPTVWLYLALCGVVLFFYFRLMLWVEKKIKFWLWKLRLKKMGATFDEWPR